jgi:hypothetical protein
MPGVALQHVGERAGRIASLYQLGVLMDRDQDDPRARMLREERRRGGDAVEAWHRDIRDDHVVVGFVRRLKKSAAVSNRGDNLELRLEQLSQLFGDPRVVFG